MSVFGTFYKQCWIACAILTCFLIFSNDLELVRTDPDNVKHTLCPFVYGSRMPSAQVGLINCTWYSDNACCKRTEVTSVFSSMLPLSMPDTLDKALAQKCRNLVNYMMCYFCAPDQANWYTTKLMICSEFCDSVHTHCADASWNGVQLGSKFVNGQEFCKAQEFEVVEGDRNCFKFDPTVFDGTTTLDLNVFVLLSALIGVFFT